MVKYYCPKCDKKVVKLEVADTRRITNVYYNSLSNILDGEDEPSEWEFYMDGNCDDYEYNFGKYKTVCCGHELAEDITESIDMLIKK